jgi:hypothetical protein
MVMKLKLATTPPSDKPDVHQVLTADFRGHLLCSWSAVSASQTWLQRMEGRENRSPAYSAALGPRTPPAIFDKLITRADVFDAIFEREHVGSVSYKAYLM